MISSKSSPRHGVHNCFLPLFSLLSLKYSRNENILGELKVEPVDEQLKGYKSNQLRHATRIKQQENDKNNAELWTKWKKSTWKTC